MKKYPETLPGPSIYGEKDGLWAMIPVRPDG